MWAFTYNLGTQSERICKFRVQCKFEPRFMLTEKVGVMNQSSVDATAELLLDPARCTRARMSSQINVKRPNLLCADAVAHEWRRSSPTRHG